MNFHEVRLPVRLVFDSTGGSSGGWESSPSRRGEGRSTPSAAGRRRDGIGANLKSLDDMAALTADQAVRRCRGGG